jgi:hypothetical protein
MPNPQIFRYKLEGLFFNYLDMLTFDFIVVALLLL